MGEHKQRPSTHCEKVTCQRDPHNNENHRARFLSIFYTLKSCMPFDVQTRLNFPIKTIIVSLQAWSESDVRLEIWIHLKFMTSWCSCVPWLKDEEQMMHFLPLKGIMILTRIILHCSCCVSHAYLLMLPSALTSSAENKNIQKLIPKSTRSFGAT